MLGADNPLLALARSGRNRTHPLLALLVALMAVFVGQLFAAIVLALLSPADPVWRQLTTLIVGFVPIALLVWAWVAAYEGRGFATLGFTRHRAAAKAARGALTGLAAFGAVTLLLAALGYVVREDRPQGWAAAGTALLVLVGWILQSSTEEILARGFVLPVVGAQWGAPAGVAASALLFAALHLLNPDVTPLSVVNLVLVGVLLGLYALYDGALWGVCLWHAVWNWAQGSLFGFPVSGQPTGTLAVLDLRETGPDAVTGGMFGPEGGVATTLVLLLGVAVIAVAARRRPASPPAPPA
ncbi:type II CAAX prenyl endopeptidase Rce1 family protein [Thermoactinospora rubra]|uniref:CPBP family glutamic-type intramembrane protease n=1 Tax=Thermoactinospora rubra TaxID=1088767 RepID=UPI000A0F5EF4|nr:CPBP family glutamic-type intramembrane protease [Thermoactinospora rubra]